MRIKSLLLFFFLIIAAVPAFAQYEGGDSDGEGVGSSCVTTLDGVGMFSIGSISGPTQFCDFSTESFTVSLTNAPLDIDYFWSGPAGSTVVNGQDTPTALFAFGNTPGNVSVDIITACGSTTITFAVTGGICTMFTGGDNDGFSIANSCSSTIDGASLIAIAPAIVGSVNFCESATESYSVAVANAPANTYYSWSVPAGATFTGQGSSVILVTFGSAAGNVSVNIITDCSFDTRTMAVTPQNCTFYAGGDNDGFSQAPSCSTDLNGGPTFVVTGITGSSTFCDFGTEGFSAVVLNAPANTYYNWNVPAGATITGGQGTANILVTFGNTSGDVTVDVITDCVTVPQTFAVTSTNCSFYAGGTGDGFSQFLSCSTKLDGTPALVPGPIIGSTTFCDFSTETYSINPVGTSPETTYTWSVPAGAVITSGQGTTTILVTFSNNSGNVSVDVSNLCQIINVALPVTTTNCIFYAGGDNDGFSVIQQCASNLNGGSTFTPGPIVGSANACNFSTETYSITVAGALSNAVYVWSVPPGATITSGQGTATILVTFGNTNGNVSVSVSNECETINVSSPITVANCIFYAGGDNDGFSVIQQCASNLNGGSTFIPGLIVGSANACNFSTETYSITVAGALSNAVYTWTVPSGAAVTSGQGTSTIIVTWGNTSGNVSVAVNNECDVVNVSTPVSVANCIFYAGGDNDGFSQTRTCNTTLDGVAALVPGVIAGVTTFCNFTVENYSITPTGTTATTTYTWTVPSGASIMSGQGTTAIVVSFGTSSGNVAVTISNDCQTTNISLPVTTSGTCIYYAGGTGDGFAVATVLNAPLPIQLVSFDASVENGIVFLKWETASEIDNDFFMIERSKDGQNFEELVKVEGAGTSKQKLNYQAKDIKPYHGTSYYRLSQTDYDGAITYFRVLIVKVLDFGEVTRLYPNPVEKDAELNVDYFAEEDGEVKISIVNPAGIGSDSQMVVVKAGVNLFRFTPHFQSAGVHIIIIRSKDKAQALRLVVL